MPVLFGYHIICTGWRVLFKSFTRMSVFLVLLLSVSRAISMVAPLRKVSRTVVLRVLVVYLFYLPTEVIVFSIVWRNETGVTYDITGVYCFEDQPENLYNSLYVASLGLPAILITFSFIVSVVAIRNSMKRRSLFRRVAVPRGVNREEGRRMRRPLVDAAKRQASWTILIFTLTYLIFNLPHCINMILWMITMNRTVPEGEYRYPGTFYDNKFMYAYSWNITEVLSCGLNSASNPLVYYCRMSAYRKWLNGKVREVVNWEIPQTWRGWVRKEWARWRGNGYSDTMGPVEG
eukprot:sb/3467655/